MGRFHQATSPDDAVDQLLLAIGLLPTWFGFGALQGIGWLLLKLLLLSCAIVLLETVNAKLRLFRVPELLAVPLPWDRSHWFPPSFSNAYDAFS